MNIKIAQKIRSFILDLLHVKLSLKIFFFSELFNGELIKPAFRIKNTQQKAANLIFCLTLTAEKVVKCNMTFFVGGFQIHLCQEVAYIMRRISAANVIAFGQRPAG